VLYQRPEIRRERSCLSPYGVMQPATCQVLSGKYRVFRGKRAGDRSGNGFTLLELVVVLAVLAVITAMIIPGYGASITAMQGRSARGDFVALLYFAQELAVHESREIRLYLDKNTRAYWLEGWVSGHGDAKRFAPLPDPAQGGPRYFPPKTAIVEVHARTDATLGFYYIAFFPGGGSDRAAIALSRGEGEDPITIRTTGALGGIEVAG